MIRLIEVRSNPNSERYLLKEILVNPNFIVSIEEEEDFNREMRLNEHLRPKDLDSRAQFVKITLSDGKKHRIVGTTTILMKKLTRYSGNTRNILKD